MFLGVFYVWKILRVKLQGLMVQFLKKSLFVAVLTGLAVTGCSPAEVSHIVIGMETKEGILLPPPPATPKVRYLYSVKSQTAAGGKSSEADLGASAAEPESFRLPISISSNEQGTFYVVDQAHSKLLSFEPERNQWNFTEPDAGEPLSSLVGIASDKSGGIYLTDSVLKKVFRMRGNGGKLERFAPDHVFERPTGIAFDPFNKHIYVVDTIKNTVVAFDLSGRELFEFGRRGTGEGEFNYPTFIAPDRQGNLYVSDTLNFRVQSFTADGKFRFSFGRLGDGAAEFAEPKGLAVSPEGIIYVVDGRLDKIQAFSPDGDFLFSFGSSGTAAGQFWLANGIYVDEKDRVYVCDYLNNRVQVFQHLGEK